MRFRHSPVSSAVIFQASCPTAHAAWSSRCSVGKEKDLVSGRLDECIAHHGSSWMLNALSDATGSLLPELLGEPDENSFWAPDIAEPIRVLVLDHFADELRAAFAEPGERIVDVLHGEHDA